MKGKKQMSTPVYYLVVFILSIAVGFYAKSLAAKYVTIGFDDDKIQTSKSDHDFKKIEKEVEKMREEQAAQNNSAGQAQEQGAAAGEGQVDAAAAPQGGTCSE